METVTPSRTEQDILAAPATRAILCSDGDGRPLRALGAADDAAAMAEAIDVATAALEALGAARGLGALQTAALSYKGGYVVMGCRAEQRVAILTGGDANLGMVLSQLRALLAERAA